MDSTYSVHIRYFFLIQNVPVSYSHPFYNQDHILSVARIKLEEPCFSHEHCPLLAPELGGKTICSHSFLEVQLKILSTMRFCELNSRSFLLVLHTAKSGLSIVQASNFLYLCFVSFGKHEWFNKDSQTKLFWLHREIFVCLFFFLFLCAYLLY